MIWLNLIKTLSKSKLFWVAIIVVSLGLFMWHYGGLYEKLGSAYATVTNLTNALETTNKSIQELQKEIDRIDEYVQVRKENREAIHQELNSLKQELLKERNQNESLQECWDVDLGEYADRLSGSGS